MYLTPSIRTSFSRALASASQLRFGVDQVTTPQPAEHPGRFVAKTQPDSQEPVGADNPKVAATLRVESVPDVVPKPEDAGSQRWQVGTRCIVDQMLRVVAARLDPVPRQW